MVNGPSRPTIISADRINRLAGFAGACHAHRITAQREGRAGLEHGVHERAAGDEHQHHRTDHNQRKAGRGHGHGGHLDAAGDTAAEHGDIAMAGECGAANQENHRERGDTDAAGGG